MIDSLTIDYGTAGKRALVSGDLVMGLRWDNHTVCPGQQPAQHADLDAICVLFNTHDSRGELVHPGNTRNSNGSVVHTGDCTTGASPWDDERIFASLDALPEAVSTLAFVVRNPTGRVFGAVPNACAHLSDATTERVYLHADLQPYGSSHVHCVAILRRQSGGWHFQDRTEAGPVAVAAEFLVLTITDKA